MMIGGKRPGETQYAGQTLHISAERIVDTTAPYELVSQDARELLGDRAADRAHGRGARVAAGRLRHRHAAGRSPASWRWSARRRRSRSTAATSSPAPEGLARRRDRFPKVTVGGTHTALMAAALADGTTVIENAAREPEIERRRRLPHQDGREDLRRRHARASCVEGVAKLARRTPPACCPTASRPAPMRWRSP